MNKEFLHMQKLAGLITEGQYKQLIENKQGDKVEGGYVLASPDDNEITDAEFDALLALCDGATEDNFLVVSKTKPEYGVNYSGKQLVDLIKKGAAEIICKDKLNEAEGDLVTLLYSLRNSINSENKKESLSKLEGILSTVRDMEDAQLNEIEGNPDDYADDYTPPAYTAINDMMDYIKQGTGISGRIVPYRSISWLPGVSDTDGDMDMLTYKKGKQEIAIGADDVYQDAYDENSNVWIIDSNDPDLYFEEHMTFKEAVEAVSEWLES